MNALLRENATSAHVNVTCHELINHVTRTIAVRTSVVAAVNVSAAQTDDVWRHLLIKFVVDTCLAPIVCAFGIVGNAVNLFVLTRKQMQCTLKHMERSYNEGLVALAMSDLAFCFVYLVVSFADRKLVYSSRDFRLHAYLNTYQEPVLNIFLFSSTWLTVVMAIGRYIAICRPLHARRFISVRATRVAISLVFVTAFFVNLPRFWRYYVLRKPCSDYYPPSYRTYEDCTCFIYIKVPGALYRSIKFGYGIVLGTLTIFLPMAILVLCNLCLIRALRRSYAMQRMCCASQPKETGHRITPTLIALIVCFVTLVGPSEVLGFFGDQIVQRGRRAGAVSRPYGFETAVVVCNCLLLVNFAVSVVLYCVINVQFRRVIRDVFCCHALGRRRKRNALQMASVKSYQNTITCHVSDMETEI